MLDTTTKRRIDTARDILVGKVPDPKSQVEQITIALIYKFMDDMDARSEELGGKRAFFSGEYEKYGWKKLMSKELSGFEVLNLYADAIQKMNLNPNIPQLFRDIFKNAYLPYRDPETLKSFLKIIDDFEYDHSEKLGDAFEYLLSVLGSQGDAGQFRTPRHIIDFMVEVIDPKKEDRILDPACGTAGFLISSYKHIVKHNSSNFNPVKDKDAFEVENVDLNELTANGNVHYNGDNLLPDDRAKLSRNIIGYDISPDMVRLSLVNLYLHGFTDPKIFEYDTLTSEDNWNEFADIILANPPFMSPKGGIKPHKRFSVQSKRSEVLFVDYISEHLTTSGKAAVIVPEGIIFQSGTSYKQLRKMLADNSLFAVVSLPAGMFNPYSGVKTSILLMDKALSKKTDNILFIKIENDGFELGAQRRAKTGSQLPQAVKIIKDYIQLCHSGLVKESKQDTTSHSELVSESLKEKHGESSLWSIATKEQIAENEDYNLSGERYKSIVKRDSKFKIVELGNVVEVISGQSPEGKYYNDNGNGTPFYQGKTEFGNMYIGKPTKWTTKVTKLAQKGDILMSVRAPVGPVNITNSEICIGRGLAALRSNSNVINPYFLFYYLRENEDKIKGNLGAAFASINKLDIQIIQIPLPPLEIQKEIVEEIEGYQKIIDGARQVVENYKPHIDIDPSWEMVELGEIIKLSSGRGLTSANMNVGNFPVYGGNGINGYHDEYFIEDPTIVIGRVGAYCGSIHITEYKSWVTDNGLYITEFLRNIDLLYLSQMLTQLNLNTYAKVGGQPSISQRTVLDLKIPLPTVNIQKELSKILQYEKTLVANNQGFISIFEQKIKDSIAKVWGE